MKKPFRIILIHLLPILSLCLYACESTTESVAHTLITIENEQLRVQINPIGAELFSIYGKNTQQEYLWQGDSAFWPDRAPVMFPVNVRFEDNRFTYKGKEYEMPRMGLAIKGDFAYVATSTEREAIFSLKSSEKTLQYYPFEFDFEIRYILDGNTLKNQFSLNNTGTDSMYFALGGHPGFRFPYGDKQNRSLYAYTFSDNMTISRIEIANSLVQPNVLPFLENEHQLSLVDTRVPANGSGMFLKGLPSRKVGLGLKDQGPFIELDLGDFPNVNLWSPPGYPYACIEPMLSHHDLLNSPVAIEEKRHLEVLAVGQKGHWEFSITVLDLEE